MLKLTNKIHRNRKTILLVVLFCCVFGLFDIDIVKAQTAGEVGSFASNTVGYAVALVLSWIAYIVTAVLGLLITLLINILVSVAQFNNIIDVETVRAGWVIVRDLCNMFFVLIVLVIAFATILKYENYHVKKLLPKLLIMAVLINFSKTIFGLIIDFSQVIMLTFVNGFANGHGWFIEMFRVQNLLSAESFTDNPLTQWGVVIAIIAGVFAAFATLIVIAIMLAILVMRIIMLWIYTILSPFIFLSFAFPPLQKYTSRIWEDFVKQVMVGPILAFFIWLALTTAQKSSDALSGGSIDASELCVGGGAFFCNTNFQGFIITIGLLIGGLIVTQQLGGMAGAAAGKGMAAIHAGRGLAWKGMKNMGAWTGRKLDTAQTAIQRGGAKGLSKLGLVGEDYKAKSLNYRMIKEGWDKNKADKMSEYESGLSGTWQDRFHRASTAQGGIGSKVPLYAAGRRAKARKERNKLHESMKEKEKMVETKEEQRDASSDSAERERLDNSINELKTSIAKDKGKIITAREKLPTSRQYDIEKRRETNEYHGEINKEDHNEESLIAAYLMEKNQSKKKAYFQHIVDVNGTNNLFATMGEEMNFKGIKKHLEDTFDNDSGEVAADMSKRAEAAGNSKLMGFYKMDISTGKNEIVENEKTQINIALSKNKEKFDQSFARNEHFDSLVDQDERGNRNLSRLGIRQLLNTGQSAGRMDQVTRGNFQDRYGKLVVELNKKEQFSDTRLKDEGLTDDEIKAVRGAVEQYYKYYDPKSIESRKKQEEQEKMPKERKPDSELPNEEWEKKYPGVT